MLLRLLGGQGAAPAPSGAILGCPLLTAQQMENYCHQINPTAPYYAEHYLHLGSRLGVRGDLAFAQSLHETDYFRFGGDVAPWQNNFAGLGATGGGVKGAVFDTPEQGILAQLQHLFAYAERRPLPAGMLLVDPRFELISRGVARHVDDLDGRWVVPGGGYGSAILWIWNQMNAASAAPWGPAERANAWRINAALAAQHQQERKAAGSPPATAANWLSAPGAVTAQQNGSAHADPDPTSPAVYAYSQWELFPTFFMDASSSWYRVRLPGGNWAWVDAAAVSFTPPAPRPRQQAVIILDAGHGGSDSGATGPSGAQEKDLTLAIVLAAADQLEQQGLTVWRTRDADADVDLDFRTDLANALDADCFISFHLNSGPPDVGGTESYWQCGEEAPGAVSSASQRLACLLQSNTLAAVKGSGCTPQNRGVLCRLLSADDSRDYYHVLRQTVGPAALLEAMFISNPTEEACLLTAAVQSALAGALATAVTQYLDPTATAGCTYPDPLVGL